jgi:ketosteroid isomerase-like protein
MSDSPKRSRLEQAIDTVEIRDVLTRYCRGFERGDVDLAASAYHEDATENHGPFKGKARDFLNFMLPILATYEVSIRHITNVSLEFDGDTALSEASFFAILRESGSAVDDSCAGRYFDRFERRNGEWRIAARLAVIDWWRREPRNALTFPPDHEEILKWGKRGLDNPSIRDVICPR